MSDPQDHNPAKEWLAYLDELLRRGDEYKRMEPEIIKARGTAAWQAEAVDALQKEFPGMAREVKADLAPGIQALKNILPLPPIYDLRAAGSTTTAAVSGANIVYEALISARIPAPQPTISQLIAGYAVLQKEQDREADAASRVAELFPALADRFAEASRAAHVALGSLTAFAEETAANAMRNFLMKLKGELMEKTRHMELENITWKVMAARLCAGPNIQVLLEQEHIHSDLNNWLSPVLKARHSAYSFRETWVRFLDHVYITCGAVLASRKP